jgi:hypothetical protein
VGGWRLSGAFQARTGFPITVTDGRGSSLQATRGNERPNCVGDPTPANQTLDHWLDINAFARAPGFKNLNAALAKRVSVGGARSGEFRLEAFNLTNTPSFSPPARDISVPNTFGTITNTVSAARTVELVFKFFF